MRGTLAQDNCHVKTGTLREGLSNRDIAGRLFVSVETVRTHVHHVLSKVGVRSRTQLLVRLSKEGYE